MNVVSLKPRGALPDDTASQLRDLAERVEKGEITELVIALVSDDVFEFLFPSSLTESLVLANLLHQKCIDRFRE